MNYRSRNDFVIQAIEKEIQHAAILQSLSDEERSLFESILKQKRVEALREVLNIMIRRRSLVFKKIRTEDTEKDKKRKCF